MKSFRPVAMLLGVALLASCDTGSNPTQSIAGPTAGSAVKFFNFGMGAPIVNFYADSVKVSAASTTTCSSAVDGSTTDSTCLTLGKESTTSATGYGGVGIAGFYASMTPGAHVLSAHVATATDNGLAIDNVPTTLADGKFYSYYLSGPYNTTTKAVDGFVVEDALPAIDFTAANVRFVNASSNAQPMTLYAKSQVTGIEVPIGSTVAYKGAGPFVRLPNDIYDLSIRTAGSGTNVLVRTGVSFSASRVYTITLYGDITLSTGTNKATLDNTANR